MVWGCNSVHGIVVNLHITDDTTKFSTCCQIDNVFFRESLVYLGKIRPNHILLVLQKSPGDKLTCL